MTASRTWVAWLVAGLGYLYYLTPLAVPLLGGAGPSAPVAVVLVVTGAAAIALLGWRERHPVAVAVAVAVLLGVSPSAFGAALVAQENVTRLRGRRSGIAVGLLFVLARTLGLALTVGSDASGAQVEWILTTAGIVTATLVGFARADAGRARQDAEDARVAGVRLLERERIAREMHDVVAHRISLVALHSGALEYRAQRDPETAELAGMIRANAQSALEELRAMLLTLRDSSGEAPPEAPQPALDDVGALVRDAADAGQVVELEVTGDVDRIAAPVSRHAYRIVQEAVTNARKHAPGAAVAVVVVVASDVCLTVTNAAPEGGRRDPRGGRFGLVGVAERVEQVGGSLEHGVRDGRFVLDARLPLRGADRGRMAR